MKHGIDKCSSFAIGGIALSPDASETEACDIAAKELKRAGINPARLRFDIYKASVDARKRQAIRIVYSVAVTSLDGEYSVSEDALLRLRRPVIRLSCAEPELSFGSERAEQPPLVVGMGPCGLFCALALAENGYKPILIDRGDGIAERCRKTAAFRETGRLDTESNVQFGAGGAGTFSDGKLVTRVGDKRVNYILRRFCDFGAPEEILTSAKPHIGTDMLVAVVDRMLERIRTLGGTVLYRCRLDAIEDGEAGCIKAVTTCGDISCSSLVLAVGHSARYVRYAYEKRLLHRA